MSASGGEGAGTAGTAGVEAEEAWEDLLDRLEGELGRAERLLETLGDGDLTRWQDPVAPGPLPARLVPRAQRLLDGQRQLIAHLPSAIEQTRRQVRVTDRFSRTTRRAGRPSVYLDVTA